MSGNGFPHEENLERELNRHFSGEPTLDHSERLHHLENSIDEIKCLLQNNGGGSGKKYNGEKFIIKLVIMVAVVLGAGFIGYRHLESELHEMVIEASPWLKERGEVITTINEHNTKIEKIDERLENLQSVLYRINVNQEVIIDRLNISREKEKEKESKNKY